MVATEFVHRTSTRSRSLRLRVEQDGTVVVTSPPRVPSLVVQQFVASHQAWIAAQRQRFVSAKELTITGETVQLFGVTYTKKVAYSNSKPVGIAVKGSELLINPADPHWPESKILTSIERFLKNTAEQYIIPRTKQLAEKMVVTVKSITMRQQKTRWGSCSSDGSIQFNWRLVHYAPEIIDYVIVHELAHRVHMNHSSAFWKLVGQYDPEYTKHRGWLRRHGLSLG